MEERDDRPKLEDLRAGQKCVVVIGSSVAEGYNAWRKHGWAWRLGEALREKYGYFLANVSQCGANTAVTKARFAEAVGPWKPDIVIIGLSLGNEGLAHCSPGERRALQHIFETGMLDLLRMVVAINAVPVLGGVYPNNDYCPETYEMLKETNRTMSSWGVPVLDWLSALDDGRGRWKPGTWHDHAHPNTEGHRLMFEAVDLSLFDPAPAGDEPELIRRRSSLNQFDRMERKTSHSALDPEVVAFKEEAMKAAPGPVDIARSFDDGRGFSLVHSSWALSIRNKTEFEYKMSGDWGALCEALRAAGLGRGVYLCRDGSALDGAVLYVWNEGILANELKVPPGADAVFRRVIVLSDNGGAGAK